MSKYNILYPLFYQTKQKKKKKVGIESVGGSV